MGSNPHGKKNEESLCVALHNKQFKDIKHLNLKTFIKEINPTITDKTLILCPYTPGMKKQDLQIVIGQITYNISVKVGSGNSIHQEKLNPFLKMLKEKYNIKESLANDIRMFIWGDGTTDGTALQENRINNYTFKKKYPHIINNIQGFFNEYRTDLLNRFLVTGTLGSKVDYIYYGTPLNGVWCTAADAITFQTHAVKYSRTAIGLGDISFQAWNRCITGTKKEKDRDTIQLKWGSIQKDITAIRHNTNKNLNIGTHEGDCGEFNFTKALNQNKNVSNTNWKFLSKHLNIDYSINNVYAVKVSSKVYSKVIEKKVLPKTDLYLIKSDIDSQFLLLNNYHLDERMLKDLNYEIIKGSGISVKRPDSTKYTIQKLSPSLFTALFGNTYLAAGASLYCNEKELIKNSAILTGWNSSYEEITSHMPDFSGDNVVLLNAKTTDAKVNLCKQIKTFCNNQIKDLILDNPKIYNLIFKGESNFDEPYVANFIYKNDKLQLNIPTDFSVTTGSGRTRGNYSIEIKPK